MVSWKGEGAKRFWTDTQGQNLYSSGPESTESGPKHPQEGAFIPKDCTCNEVTPSVKEVSLKDRVKDRVKDKEQQGAVRGMSSWVSLKPEFHAEFENHLRSPPRSLRPDLGLHQHQPSESQQGQEPEVCPFAHLAKPHLCEIGTGPE